MGVVASIHRYAPSTLRYARGATHKGFRGGSKADSDTYLRCLNCLLVHRMITYVAFGSPIFIMIILERNDKMFIKQETLERYMKKYNIIQPLTNLDYPNKGIPLWGGWIIATRNAKGGIHVRMDGKLPEQIERAFRSRIDEIAYWVDNPEG